MRRSSLVRAAWMVCWATMVCCGNMVAVASAAEPVAEATNHLQLPVCDQLPGDVSLAISIRPAELAGTKLAPVLPVMDQLFKPSLGFSLSEVESLTFVVIGPLFSDEPGHGKIFYLRARADQDWKHLREQAGALQTETRAGRTIHSFGDDEDRRFLWSPDKRSLVFATEEGLARVLGEPDPNDKSEFDAAWTLATRQPIALLFRIKSLASLDIDVLADDERTALLPIERVALEGKYLTVAGEPVAEGVKLHAALTTESEDAAQRAAPAVDAFLKELAQGFVQMLDTSGDDNGEGLSKIFQAVNEPVTTGLVKLAGEARYRVEGSTVYAEGTADPKLFELATFLTLLSYVTSE